MTLRFIRLIAEKRLRALLIKKYCTNCLAHENSAGNCRSGDRRKTCDRNHHYLFYMHEHASRIKSGDTLHCAQHRSRHFSRITASLAIFETGAPRRAPFTHSWPPLSGCRRRKWETPFCKAIIRSKADEATKVVLVLKIEPNVRIGTPIRALSGSFLEKFRYLPLADERFHRPATISLVDEKLSVAHPNSVHTKMKTSITTHTKYIQNKEERYSQVPRLSDTRYSANATKGKWRYASSTARLKPTPDLNIWLSGR